MIVFVVGQIQAVDGDGSLRVVASRTDRPSKQWFANVDAQGQFSLSADNANELFDTRIGPAKLIIRVMRGASVVSRQRLSIRPTDALPSQLNLALPSGDGFWVGGRVRTPSGDPAPEMPVVVFSVTTTDELSIAQAQTDDSGFWEVIVPDRERPVDLRVAVVDASGAEIVSSPLRCNVRAELEEMLTVPEASISRATRYERLRAKIESELDGQPFDSVADHGIELIACRVEESVEVVRQVRESVRWETTGASAAAVFALGENSQASASAVLSLPRGDLSETLETAIAGQIIPSFEEPIERVVTTLREVAALFANAESPALERRVWLRELGIPEELSEEISRFELLGELDEDTTWERIARGQPGDIIERARDGVELSAMGLTHGPLVQLLSSMRQTGSNDSLRQMLPRLDLEDIEALLDEEVDGRIVDVPRAFRAAGGNRRAYALGVMRSVERRYPTATVLHARARLRRDTLLAEVVELNPDLDLHVSAFTERSSVERLVLPQEASPETVLAELRLAQRQFSISPPGRRVETMTALHDANLESAAAVVTAGPAMFVRAVGGALDVPTMRHAYRLASRRSATGIALTTRHMAALEVYSPNGPLTGSTANLESLFGSLSFCACEHCRSVLSPASYLAQLLQFIRRIPVGEEQNLFDVLVSDKRRSDVPNLALDCANSHTPLPYIDLVNELLEFWLPRAWLTSNGSEPIALDPPIRQTTRSEDELRAHPEYLLTETYVGLRDEVVFPMSLPFDLFFTEVVAYLNKISITWAEVLSTLAPTSPQSASDIGAAALGLSPSQLRIIVDEHPGQLASMWGVSDLNELAAVDRFMAQADLSFPQLMDLLATRFFQRPVVALAGSLDIRISPEPPCDVVGATFVGLPTNIERLMGRTHRFLRLWRATGWSIREVDLGVINVGQSEIDRETIASFASVSDLGIRFPSVSRIEMLAWWRNLETNRGPQGASSHFDDLFIRSSTNRALGAEAAVSMTFERLRLNDSRTELVDANQALEPLVPRLAGAFQVPVAALDSLLDAMGETAPTEADLASVSMLFRYVSFGRAIGITPSQVRRWTDVLGLDPFESPATTVRFLALKQSVFDLGADLDSLSYALGFAESGSTVPLSGDLASWLVQAVLRMQSVAEPDLGADATPVDALHVELSGLLDEVSLSQAMSYFGVADAGEEGNPSLESLLESWVTAEVLNQAQVLIEQGELIEASATLLASLSDAGRAARQSRAASASLAEQAGIHAASVVSLISSVTVDIDDDTSPALLDALAAQSVQDLQFDLEALTETGGPPEIQALVPSLRRWHRGAVLLNTLRLGANASTWFVENAQSLGAVEPHRLAEASPFDHDALVRTIAISGLIRRHSTALPELFELIEFSASHLGQSLTGTRLAELANLLGWDAANAQAVSSQLGLRLRDVLDGSAIRRIDNALKICSAGDIAPDQLIGWVNSGATPATANEIKALVSARIPPQRWAGELGAVRDPIREQQRDAMVASYLHHNPALTSPSDLYAKFVIDPDMNACRTASRIQQGTAAVQRLMFRVLNGLESDISVSERIASEWTWMSTYRVWEANLKVFLWPENWLDPKLRRDRTPLFDEVVAGLSGTEVTDRDGEGVVRDYLHGLRAIARLSVAGLHYDELRKRLHVIARAGDTTRTWYHRVHAEGVWEPWREMPLQIEAPEVLPFTFRDQLMVVWPKLKEAGPNDPDSDPGDESSHTEVRLAWAFHENGDWSEARDTGDEVFVTDQEVNYESDGQPYGRIKGYKNLRLTAKPDSDGIRISPTVNSYFSSVGGLTGHTLLKDFVSDPGADKFDVDSQQAVTFLPFYSPGWMWADKQSFRRTDLGFAGNQLRLPIAYPNGTVAQSATLVSLTGHFTIFSSLERPPREKAPGFDISKPSTLEHRSRTFVLWPRLLTPLGAQAHDIFYGFRFELLYHPFASELLQQLAKAGVEGIYRPRLVDPETGSPDFAVSGLRRQRASIPFEPSYQPGEFVNQPFPEESFEFAPSTSYGEYNWELFFHLPLMVAEKLATVGRFADAKRWLERLFDPRGEPVSQSPDPASWYWMTKPLWQAGKTPSIEDDLALLNSEALTGEEIQRRSALRLAIDRWRARPFEPHVIAQLRPGAYQRQTVMAYLDNLIAWGDSLFSRRTAEAMDEATQLYLLAADLLGPRPLQLPRRDTPTRSFNDLVDTQDEFGNLFVEIENFIPVDDDEDTAELPDDYQVLPPEPPPSSDPDHLMFDIGADQPPDELNPGGAEFGNGIPPWALAHIVGSLTAVETTRVPYFCVPPNEKLLGYWDTVEDRLYKLRNCLDLEGQRLVPDLFAPPIDPGALVAAIAQGVDLASAIDDLFAPTPHYRFHAALTKAKDLNTLVRDLGRTVLSAIERSDSERFSLISNEAEQAVLHAVSEVHQQRIQEAMDQIEVLNHAWTSAQSRVTHFETLISEGSISEEESQRDDLVESRNKEAKAAKRQLAAGIVHAVPAASMNITQPRQSASLPGGITFGFSYGTPQIAAAISASAEFNAHRARRANSRAGLRGIDAANERRLQDWKFNRDQASLDTDRIDAELTVANIRKEIASREFKVHQHNVSTNQQVRAFLQAKYTQIELHDWMANAAATVHRAAFNLAIDLARKAQRAYRYELADSNATFIDGGYWESNRKGLLASERLALDIERMEVGYIENNRREHELLKRISLAQIDPGALLQLRYTGSCEIDVPEVLFDLDHPSHFLRRLRRVAVTIPAIAGPYTNVNATLTLQRSQTRPAAGAEPLVDLAAGSYAIAISSGQSDAGVFSDSQGDSRRMPFEGRGAVSRWQLTLPPLQQFDYRTIADCILELHYTARSGATPATPLEVQAQLNERSLGLSTQGWARSWSVRTDFPDSWQDFRQPSGDQQPILALEVSAAYYPFALGPGATRRLRQVQVFVETDATAEALGPVEVAGPTVSLPGVLFSVFDQLPGTLAAFAALDDDAVGALTLTFPASLDPALINDLVVLVEYDVNLSAS